jgi:predicted transcriptional regulator
MIERIEKEIEMIERHIEVLNVVLDQGPVGIVKISDNTGYPRHKIRYSLRVLEEEALIKPTNKGAKATEEGRVFADEIGGRLNEISETLTDMNINSETER